MTVQELEQALLNLSLREKLRIVQLLLKNISGLWKGTTTEYGIQELQPPQSSPVDALGRLAAIEACHSIDNPVNWQQQQREDRGLPGREL